MDSQQALPRAHGERKHAIFSASSAFRWAGYPGEPGCPVSALRCQKLPSELSSPAAAEGTRAHEFLEAVLRIEDLAGQDAAINLRALPHETPEAGAQMRAGVRIAVRRINELKRLYPELQVYLELEIMLRHDLGGTFDILCYDPETRQCWVIDFKYGKVPVHPENNPQLLCYGALARHAFEFPVWSYTLGVIQPRDYSLTAGQSPCKEWDCPPSTVEAWKEQMLRAVEEAYQGVCRPRADRCRRCRAAIICDEIAPKIEPLPIELIKPKAPRKKKGEDKQPAPPPFLRFKEGLNGTPVPVDPKAIGHSVLARAAEAFAGLPAIEAYVAAVTNVCEELAVTHGLNLPGLKVVYKNARISWDADEKTVANWMWNTLHISPAETLPQKLISITDAKELIAAKLTTWVAKAADGNDGAQLTADAVWEQFTALTKRLPSGAKELVFVSDKRPSSDLVDMDSEATATARMVGVRGAEEIRGRG